LTTNSEGCETANTAISIVNVNAPAVIIADCDALASIVNAPALLNVATDTN